MLQEAKRRYEVANLQKPQYRSRRSSSCRLVLLATLLARRKRERTVTLRHNRYPIFFFSYYNFPFFFYFLFFSEGVGGRGTWLRYLFVCLLSFKFFKVRLRRVENAAVGENPAPNKRRVSKEDRSCNCPHRTFTSELTSDSNKRRV